MLSEIPIRTKPLIQYHISGCCFEVLYKIKINNIINHLPYRLVWEAALLSCVVYGYLESNNLLIDEQYRSEEREYSSDYICYLLYTISCCRYVETYTIKIMYMR